MTRPAASRLLWALGFAALQLAVCPALAPAADGDDTVPVKVEVHILTELNIAGLTIETDPFAAWVDPIIQAVEQRFKNEKSARDVVIQVTLHKRGPLDVA